MLTYKPVMAIGLAVLLLASCTKKFDEINKSPNSPQSVTPGILLGQMQYRMVNITVTASRNFTNQLMQVDAPRASAGGTGLHRYVVNPGSGVWTSVYTLLTDVQDIYTIASQQGDNNYKAIALVYKSWAYSLLTDLYGDVPFSQATDAVNKTYTPVFDKQKDIYTQILKDLDSANLLFNDVRPLTFGGDMVYNSATPTTLAANAKNAGIQKWRRYCNSLELRLLLRLLKKDGEIPVVSRINAMLADTSKYPVFNANSDEAILRYPGSNPYYNPYYNARPSDWNEGDYYTKFFINNLNAWNDPRRAIWATTVVVNGVPTYQGIESGYPVTTEYVVGRNSSYNNTLKTLPQLGIMMTWAEVEFIKAELALKGYNTGRTVQQHYERGIQASMVQWGVTLPSGYLQQVGVAYNIGGTLAQQLEQIMLQKYYAYNWVDYQSWFEKRRTGFPVLPRGTGIPVENQFPWRVPYPTYLQSLNPANLASAITSMGGDNSNVKVWWDK